MNLRTVVAVLGVVVAAGCDDGRVSQACGRPCVGEERCDVPTGRCVVNAPPTVTIEAPTASTELRTAASLRLVGTVVDDSGVVREAFYRLGDGEWLPLGLEVEGTFDTNVALPTVDGVTLTLSVKGVDADGAEGTASRTLIVDRVAPTCRVTTPQAGATLTGTSVEVRLEVTDGSARFGAATLTADGAPLSAMVVDGVARFDVPLASLDGAQRRWELTAQDAAGHDCAASLDVRIDNVGPVAVISTPTQGATVTRGSGGAIPVRFAVTDGVGVVSAEVLAPPSTLWQPAPLTAGQGTFDWQVPASDEDVDRTFKVRATDAAGNVGAEASVTVTVDVVPPTCTLEAPMPAQVLSAAAGPVFAVTWTVHDGSNTFGAAEVSVDDGATWIAVATDATGHATWPWTLDPQANGATGRVRVRGRDAAGNVCPEQLATVSLDLVRPTVAITSPAANTSVRFPTVTISGTVSDGAQAVASMSLDFGDGVGRRTVAVVGQAWTLAVPTLATEDFVAHQVVVRALDAAGNEATATLALRVDRVAPVVTVPRPLEGERLNATRLVQGDAVVEAVGADGDPFTVVEAETAPGVFTPIANGEHPVTTASTDNDVPYTVRVRARDTAGNVSTLQRSFRVDRVAPTLTFTAPAADAKLGTQAVVFTGEASDGAGGSVGTMTLDFADGVGPRPVTVTGQSWTTSVANPVEDFVAHQVTLRAVDLAGNVATATRQVWVDRVAPQIFVVAPTEGQRFNAQQLAPSNVASMTVSLVDGDPSTTLELDPNTNTWTSIAPGTVGVATAATDDDVEYTRHFRARDRAGNEAVVTRRFRVDRVAPTLISTTPRNDEHAASTAFSMTFSEPMQFTGTPVTFTPTAPTAPVTTIDGSRLVVSVSGLSAGRGYRALPVASALADLAGNPPAGTMAPVLFATASRRPLNGQVLIPSTATRRVEWFRTSVDQDGVLSMLVRVVNPVDQQRTWIVGWLDPVTAQFIEQVTFTAGTQGGSITSVAELQPDGSVVRKATVRVGGRGTSWVATFQGSVVSSSEMLVGVDSFPWMSSTPTNTNATVDSFLTVLRNGASDAYFNQHHYQEAPLLAAIHSRGAWSVVATAPISSTYEALAAHGSGCERSCGHYFHRGEGGLFVPRLDLVHAVRTTHHLWISAQRPDFDPGVPENLYFQTGEVLCNTSPYDAPVVSMVHKPAFLSRDGAGGVLAAVPSPMEDSQPATVQLLRLDSCSSSPVSVRTISLPNAMGFFAVTGSMVTDRGQAVYAHSDGTPITLTLPEVAPLGGGALGLIWVERPGTLKYVE